MSADGTLETRVLHTVIDYFDEVAASETGVPDEQSLSGRVLAAVREHLAEVRDARVEAMLARSDDMEHVQAGLVLDAADRAAGFSEGDGT